MSKKDERFNALVNLNPPEIKEWVTKIDKMLIGSGCKVAVDDKGNFTYTCKASKKIICRITMGEAGCRVRPNTIYANNSSSIKPDLPGNMLDIMRSARGCGGCAAKNPNFVQCKHGGPYLFTHGSESLESCRYVGFNFAADASANRDFLEKWIECELAM